jgi:hypothetical protein
VVTDTGLPCEISLSALAFWMSVPATMAGTLPVPKSWIMSVGRPKVLGLIGDQIKIDFCLPILTECRMCERRLTKPFTGVVLSLKGSWSGWPLLAAEGLFEAVEVH